MTHLFLWNPLNVADGEVQWFLEVLAWVFGTWLFLSAIHFIARRLMKKAHPIAFFWIETLYKAFFKPIVYFVWFFVFVQGIDIVCERTFSDVFKHEIKLFIQIVGLGCIGWALYRFRNAIVRNALSRLRPDQVAIEKDTISVISKLSSTLIVVALGLCALDILGVSLTTIMAFGGVSGLAIAFAAQEIVANFFGSIMIHITQPFRHGDYIILPEQKIEGFVRSIGWYQTIISGYSTKITAVPNALFTKAIVSNKTRITHRLLDETVSIAVEELSKVPQIIRGIQDHLSALDSVDPEQKMHVWIRSIGAGGIDIGLFALSTHVDESDFLALRDVVLITMVSEIQKAGAKLMYPQLVAVQTSGPSSKN